jgi:amino acid transporter
MLLQAALVSVVALVFLALPNISGSFWLLSVMTVQLYLVMYLLMFIAAIRLRYSKPDVHRAFKIPGGKLGMWIIAGLGFVASLGAFVVGFAPPAQLSTGSPVVYVGLLVVVLLAMASPALLSYQFRKPAWQETAGTGSSDSAL